MSNLENFLNHKIFFTYQREDEYHIERGYDQCFKITSIYESKTIHDPIKFNITTIDKLMDKIKPFLSYLGSKYVWKISDYNFNVSNFNISFIIGAFHHPDSEEENEYYEIVNIVINNYTKKIYILCC